MYVTKQGKHGTLHLYLIEHHDRICPEYGHDKARVWAYNSEHAVEKFLDSSEFQGFTTFEIDGVSRVKVRS